MENMTLIRNSIVQNLKRERGVAGLAAVEIDGDSFSAVDVALPDENGNYEVYRITVTKHGKQKTLT